MKQLLSNEELKSLDERIKLFESKTSVEFVCMIQNQSNEYLQGNLRGALLINTILHGILLFLEPWQDGFNMLISFAFGVLLFQTLIEKIAPLKRAFVKSEEMQIEVNESAMTHFFSKGLYKTDAKNGLLVYISNFEHKINIIADEGLFPTYSQERWDEFNKALAQKIKADEACKGIEEFIETIEDDMIKYFPAGDVNPDELANIIQN